MAMVKLKIDGMTCDQCVRTVTRVLTDIPGVAAAKAETGAAMGSTTVSFDPGKATVAAMIAAVAQEGYEVIGRGAP